MDETPDQILARLQRHAESIQRRGAARLPGRVPGHDAATLGPGGATGALPSRKMLRGVTGARPYAGAAPRPTVATPTIPTPTIVAWGAGQASDLIPDAAAARPRVGLLVRTIAGQAVAVFACVLALVAAVQLSVTSSLVLVGVLAAAGAVATVRRLPFAGWWTVGLLLGFALGRIS